jgi:hypothetical protein
MTKSKKIEEGKICNTYVYRDEKWLNIYLENRKRKISNIRSNNIQSRTLLSSRLRKIYNTQNYNFACGSVWVWNLVSDMKGGAQTEGV